MDTPRSTNPAAVLGSLSSDMKRVGDVLTTLFCGTVFEYTTNIVDREVSTFHVGQQEDKEEETGVRIKFYQDSDFGDECMFYRRQSASIIKS